MTWPSDELRQAIFNALDRESPTTQDVLDWIKPVVTKELEAERRKGFVEGKSDEADRVAACLV